MMKEYETVACPMCLSSKGHRVRQSADIVCCSDCTTVYLRTRPTVRELEQWYQSYHSNPGSHMALPKTDGEIKSSGLRRQYFMNELLEFVGSDRQGLIDVGAGWGAFLDNARDNGFEVAGNEICVGMAEFAMKKLGIPVVPYQLEQCQFHLDKPVKVVTLLHSFEHVPSQRNALGYIHGLLADGGYIAGIVPNFSSFCSRTMGDRWPWLDSNFHYVHFTTETLKRALHNHGFNALRVYTAQDDFYPDILARQMALNGVKDIKGIEQMGQGESIRFFAQKI
jgi:hypothetical protein